MSDRSPATFPSLARWRTSLPDRNPSVQSQAFKNADLAAAEHFIDDSSELEHGTPTSTLLVMRENFRLYVAGWTAGPAVQ